MTLTNKSQQSQQATQTQQASTASTREEQLARLAEDDKKRAAEALASISLLLGTGNNVTSVVTTVKIRKVPCFE